MAKNHMMKKDMSTTIKRIKIDTFDARFSNQKGFEWLANQILITQNFSGLK